MTTNDSDKPVYKNGGISNKGFSGVIALFLTLQFNLGQDFSISNWRFDLKMFHHGVKSIL